MPRLVGMVDGAGERLDELGCRPRVLRCPRDPLVETAPFHVFERQVINAVLTAHFMDLHDVRVLESGHGFRLVAKAGDLLGGGVDAMPDDLQGHQAFQAGLLRQVDDAHAAVSQLADHGVLADVGRQGAGSVPAEPAGKASAPGRRTSPTRPAVRPSRIC